MNTISISHPTDLPNFTQVNIGPITFWFSYQTCVAFQEDGHLARVSENIWSNTTGKRLNWIDDGNKADRLDSSEFDSQLDRVLARLAIQ